MSDNDLGAQSATAVEAAGSKRESQLSHAEPRWSPRNLPAFPVFAEHERFNDETGRYESYVLPAGGMSLRDYFAAKAMQALAPVYAKDEYVGEEHIAEWAYVQADAMLKAREGK